MTIKELLRIKKIPQKHSTIWMGFHTVNRKEHLNDEATSYTISWCWDYSIQTNRHSNKHKHIDFNVESVSDMKNFNKDENGILFHDNTKEEK